MPLAGLLEKVGFDTVQAERFLPSAIGVATGLTVGELIATGIVNALNVTESNKFAVTNLMRFFVSVLLALIGKQMGGIGYQVFTVASVTSFGLIIVSLIEKALGGSIQSKISGLVHGVVVRSASVTEEIKELLEEQEKVKKVEEQRIGLRGDI